MIKEHIFQIDKHATTFLKGIAILLVILGHMGYIYNGGAWGVNLFLMLSGYGIFKSYLSGNKKGYFSKKIIKIFIPYFLVTLFVIIYNYIKYKISLKTIIFSLLGIDFGYICDRTMWYISFIFVEYIIFYLSTIICSKIKKEKLKHVLIIFLNFIFNYLIYKLDNSYMIWGRGAGIFLYIFSFSIGLLISKLSFIKLEKNNKNIMFSLGSFALILLIFILYNNVYSLLSYYIYAISLPLLLIALIDLNIIKYKNKTINYIGEMSFDIYLWEGFFLVIKNSLFESLGNNLLIDTTTIILCIYLSKIYRKLIINPIINKISSIKKLK